MNLETWYNTEDTKRYYFPGRVIVGPGVFKKAIELCSQLEGEIVVILDGEVYNLSFVKEQLLALNCSEANVKVVQGSPIAQEVQEFVKKIRSLSPAVILSIGGGSATDFAKAVTADLLFGTFDGIGLNGNPGVTNGRIKPTLICVPTTAGSGAEASRYYVTYDREDHHKVFGKSWSLVADWIMLDPIFLRSLPDNILICCAFDAFVHFFESMICRYESSRMSRNLSVIGIGQLMEAIDKVVNEGLKNNSEFSALLEAASFAGVAISNVRTGNIHEAAGALLELTDLSHPETLFVFFRDAIEQYKGQISGQEEILISHLRNISAFSKFNSIDDVIVWWEKLFFQVGSTSRIRSCLASMRISTSSAKMHILQRVHSDKVWISKESPLWLNDAAISDFIDRSFVRFGLMITDHI